MPRGKIHKAASLVVRLVTGLCEAKTTIIEKCQYLTINRSLHTRED